MEEDSTAGHDNGGAPSGALPTAILHRDGLML
jgi:hypothetical protein